MNKSTRKSKEKKGIIVFDKAIKDGMRYCCFGPYMPGRGGW